MSRRLVLVGLAAAGAFAWWEGGLDQSTTAAHIGVLAAIGVAFAAAVVAGRGRQRQPSLAWVRGPWSLRRHLAEDRTGTLGAGVWVSLTLAVIGWDLNSFAHQSRALPTLSGIFGHLTASHGGRAATVALWLALGALIALGWRRAR